tara:strand:- start:1513 stop:1686 length:174 start_codon:yes stop_codon:yes gene_type:complete
MFQRKKINMKIINLRVSWQKLFVFKINPLTLKIGQLWMWDEEIIKNYKWNKNEWIEV